MFNQGEYPVVHDARFYYSPAQGARLQEYRSFRFAPLRLTSRRGGRIWRGAQEDDLFDTLDAGVLDYFAVSTELCLNEFGKLLRSASYDGIPTLLEGLPD
jgi:hypothetical protein